MSFNQKALRRLATRPGGGVARHVKQRAEKLNDDMRDIAFEMQKKGSGNLIQRSKFDEIIRNQPAKVTASVEIGIPLSQHDSRKGRKSGEGFAKWLAKKASERDAKGDTWVSKAFKRNRHFKVAR